MKFFIYDANDLSKALKEMGYSDIEIKNICADENPYFSETEFEETCNYYRDQKGKAKV